MGKKGKDGKVNVGKDNDYYSVLGSQSLDVV